MLWLVERACADGDALILRDASSSLRLDFLVKGSALLVCFSAAVPTLEAAYALPPADRLHAADTGCAGKPFLALTPGDQVMRPNRPWKMGLAAAVLTISLCASAADPGYATKPV